MSKKSSNFAAAMETIAAISTPYGVGGIAVIRVSGEKALVITDTLFRGRVSLTDSPANTVRYGQIVCEEEVLDDVLCSVFRAPHSFTGEDTVEIACHGSLYIQQTLLQWLIDAVARMARPGEFTQRAFLNGRLDISAAEAVIDLVDAKTDLILGAHNQQTELISKEAAGEDIEIGFLTVHAQDHLMTAMLLSDIDKRLLKHRK